MATQIYGDQGKQNAITPVPVVTTTYAASPGQLVPVDASGGNVTVTLPAAPVDQSRIMVKLVKTAGSNAVTVHCEGSDSLNVGGGTSATLKVLNQGLTLQYQAAGAIWWVESDDLPLSQLDLRYPASPLTTLGDTLYGAAGGAGTRLAGNTSTTRKFLRSQGSGSVAAAPIWDTLTTADLPAGTLGAIGGISAASLGIANGIPLLDNNSHVLASELPAGTTSAAGVLQLDATAGDFQPDGTGAAGSSGKAADAKHVHPWTSDTWHSITLASGLSGLIQVILVPEGLWIDVEVLTTAGTGGTYALGSMPSSAYYPSVAKWPNGRHLPLALTGTSSGATSALPRLYIPPTSGALQILLPSEAAGSDSAGTSVVIPLS